MPTMSSPDRTGACLFCLSLDGPFVSCEHVVSQAFGNEDAVLPPGVVCDPCNNGPLSACDGAVVECPPIALMRATNFVPTKKRRLPLVQFAGGEVRARNDDGERVVEFEVPRGGGMTEGENSFELELPANWPIKKWERVSRGLLKSGLEMIAYKFGTPAALDPAYDGLRRAVLNGGYHGWVAHNVTNTPSSGCSIDFPPIPIPGTSRLGMLVGLNAFGVRLTTAWPGREDVFTQGEVSPEVAENVRVVRFAPGQRGVETLTTRLSVTFGSKGD